MKWRVLPETTDTDGVVVTHEVSSGSLACLKNLGEYHWVYLGEGKSTLACLQHRVDAPRFAPCRCGIASRRTIGPLAELIPHPVHARIRTCPRQDGRPGSLRAAVALMAEFLPLGGNPAIETGER